MKILFENKHGLKAERTFDTLKECRNFLTKHGKNIRKIQLTEGPLGSKTGELHPIKSLKNSIKRNKRQDFNVKSIGKFYKDMDDMGYFDILLDDEIKKINDKLTNEIDSGNRIMISPNAYIFDISSKNIPLLGFSDSDRTNLTIFIKDAVTSYEKPIKLPALPLPKLTSYVRKYNTFPSLEQLKKYLINNIVKYVKKYYNNLSNDSMENLSKSERLKKEYENHPTFESYRKLNENDESLPIEKQIEMKKEEIEGARSTIRCGEIADDFYYSNGGYDRDERRLRRLERELEELKKLIKK